MPLEDPVAVLKSLYGSHFDAVQKGQFRRPVMYGAVWITGQFYAILSARQLDGVQPQKRTPRTRTQHQTCTEQTADFYHGYWAKPIPTFQGPTRASKGARMRILCYQASHRKITVAL